MILDILAVVAEVLIWMGVFLGIFVLLGIFFGNAR